MTKPSARYQGDRGGDYFAEAGRFSGAQDFGRIWQARIFAPYCGPDRTVLDFGCGDGTILRAVPAQRRLAVEVNPYCLEKINLRNAGLTPPIVTREQLSAWENCIADVVISNHALEHVLDPYNSLLEMRRVLRPEGVLVLVTPFDDWRATGQRKWTSNDKQNHLYTWSPTNIGNLLTEAGFQVQRSCLRSTAWSPKIFWVQRLFGSAVFSATCSLLASLLVRREVLSVASRPRE